MVTMTDKFQIFKDMKAKLFAVALATTAAAGSTFVPLSAGIIPFLVFLSVVAFLSLFFAWTRATAALRIAEQAAAQATSNYVLLANRLIKLEKQLKMPSANPALRSTMAEVTGTVGLLGGVVRELAKNVAAQNRDVADLKGTLKGVPASEAADEKPALEIVPETLPAEAPQPEPSLLPTARRPSEDELRRMRLVMQAFDADRVELHLQPIVALPQRKIRFYEALARLRMMDGTLLGPAEFLPFLERLGRASEFDRRILERAMAVARHLIARGSEAIVGVNLSSHAINEPGFLWSLIGMLDSSPEVLGKIVLELPQDNWRQLDSDQKAALATLRDRGVPLSLDRAGDLNFDARALADLGVRFLKLPAELMLSAADQDDGRQVGPELGVRDFASALRRQGIKLVAEHVEREETVPALIDLGVPLAQGFVFSAPRAVKADVLGSSAQHPSSADSKGNLLRRAG
jgi:cyclic-di-GMP phosphodiesterase TipF (flagellum assembly factor)